MTTDNDVAAEVAKARAQVEKGTVDWKWKGEAEPETQAVEPAKPRRSTEQRIRQTLANLRDYMDAYRLGYREVLEAEDVAPLRSPDYDRRRSGKPESRTPNSSAAQLRASLILSCQAVANAVRLLTPYVESDGWEPRTLMSTVPLIRDGERTIVDLAPSDEYGWIVWKDASDVTTPLLTPADVSVGVSVLRGMFSEAQGQWEGLEDIVVDALHEAEQARFHLRTVWEPRPVEDVDKVCSRKGCWRSVQGRSVCQPCTQKDYRDRKRQEKGAA